MLEEYQGFKKEMFLSAFLHSHLGKREGRGVIKQSLYHTH
jgi:hypothetical protein